MPPSIVTGRFDTAREQLLTSADLAGEQTERIDGLRRHNIAGHGWGIACGLEVEGALPRTEGSARFRQVIISPGSAVDGYGRLLNLLRPWTIAAEGLTAAKLEAGDYAIWLVYCEAKTSPDLGEPAGQHQQSRIAEHVAVRLSKIEPTSFGSGIYRAIRGQEPAVGPRRPPFVPSEDISFPPQRELPDTPDALWPVYLGRVTLTQSKAYGAEFEFSLADRPYASLRGGSVHSVSGSCRMLLGGEEKDDRRRFAVAVAPPLIKPNPAAPAPAVIEATLVDRLVIDRNRSISFHGSVAVEPPPLPPPPLPPARRKPTDATIKPSNLTIASDRGLLFPDGKAPPTLAAPWQLYRCQIPREDDPKLVDHEELRLEIGGPPADGDARLFDLAVGVEREGKFKRILEVRADGKTFIHALPPPIPTIGNTIKKALLPAEPTPVLEVNGNLLEGPIQADLTDPSMQAKFVEAWLKGMATSIEVAQLTLVLEVTVSRITKNADDQFQYLFTIKNNGPSPVTEVRIVTLLIDVSAGEKGIIAPPHPILIPKIESNREATGTAIVNLKENIDPNDFFICNAIGAGGQGQSERTSQPKPPPA